MRKTSRRRVSRKRTPPRQVATQLPLCRIMQPQDDTPPGASGVVAVYRLQEPRPGRYAFSILANDLPPLTEAGPFDQYQGLVFVPEMITWVFPLFPTSATPPAWAGTFADSTIDPTPLGIAQVRLVNSETETIGPVVLQAALNGGTQ